MKNVPVNLYWVTTPDHDEDWFILAKSTKSAARFHVDHEGYNPGDGKAELIMQQVVGVVLDNPAPFGKAYWTQYPRHVQIEDLQKFGFEIVNDGKVGARRIVRYDGRTFGEGALDMMVNVARDESDKAIKLAKFGLPSDRKRNTVH